LISLYQLAREGGKTGIGTLAEPVIALQRQAEQEEHGGHHGGPVVQLAELELQHDAEHGERRDDPESELGGLDHPILREHGIKLGTARPKSHIMTALL
jgi:hypothetical protein